MIFHSLGCSPESIPFNSGQLCFVFGGCDKYLCLRRQKVHQSNSYISSLVWKDQQLYEIQNYREPIPGKFYLIPALKYVMPLQPEVFWILSASLVVFVLISPTRIRGTGSCFFFLTEKRHPEKKYLPNTIFKLSSNYLNYLQIPSGTQRWQKLNHSLRVRLVQVPLDGP